MSATDYIILPILKRQAAAPKPLDETRWAPDDHPDRIAELATILRRDRRRNMAKRGLLDQGVTRLPYRGREHHLRFDSRQFWATSGLFAESHSAKREGLA